MDTNENSAEGIEQEKPKTVRRQKVKNKFFFSTKVLTAEEVAKVAFLRAKAKLFDVNAWSNIPGIANAAFELYTKDGQSLKRPHVQQGDFIRIDLPGPFPNFWVKVKEVKEEEDVAEFTVQPTYDPTENDDKTVIDHFFDDRAGSTFRVERNGKEIKAVEIGINEVINNRTAQAGEKGWINTLVSEGGWAGFQKYQWKNLTDYLVGIS